MALYDHDFSKAEQPPSSQASTHSPLSDEPAPSPGLENGPNGADAGEASGAEQRHGYESEIRYHSEVELPRRGEAEDSMVAAVVERAEPATAAAAAVADAAPVAAREEDAMEIPPCAWEQEELIRRLNGCFMKLIGSEELLQRFGAEQVYAHVVRKSGKALYLLFRCEYSVEDICCILAHASVYFVDLGRQVGSRWEVSEAGHILMITMFLAQSFVVDETCRLSHWHRFLFARYCSIKVLNAALMQLLKRRGYILRVEPERLERRYAKFLEAAGVSDSRLGNQA